MKTLVKKINVLSTTDRSVQLNYNFALESLTYANSVKQQVNETFNIKVTLYRSEYVKSSSDSCGSKDIPASLIISFT